MFNQQICFECGEQITDTQNRFRCTGCGFFYHETPCGGFGSTINFWHCKTPMCPKNPDSKKDPMDDVMAAAIDDWAYSSQYWNRLGTCLQWRNLAPYKCWSGESGINSVFAAEGVRNAYKSAGWTRWSNDPAFRRIVIEEMIRRTRTVAIWLNDGTIDKFFGTTPVPNTTVSRKQKLTDAVTALIVNPLNKRALRKINTYFKALSLRTKKREPLAKVAKPLPIDSPDAIVVEQPLAQPENAAGVVAAAGINAEPCVQAQISEAVKVLEKNFKDFILHQDEENILIKSLTMSDAAQAQRAKGQVVADPSMSNCSRFSRILASAGIIGGVIYGFARNYEVAGAPAEGHQPDPPPWMKNKTAPGDGGFRPHQERGFGIVEDHFHEGEFILLMIAIILMVLICLCCINIPDCCCKTWHSVRHYWGKWCKGRKEGYQMLSDSQYDFYDDDDPRPPASDGQA